MDSDDEYERRPRGRDKFRRERSDYNDRSGRRDERSSRREDWSDRRRPVWGDSRRKDYRDFDRDRRDSGGRHHEISPPMKRVRREWDNAGFQGDYAGYTGSPMMANQWVSPMEMQQGIHQRPFDNPQHPIDPNTGPAMMSFKQFLNSMEDTIDDMEAVKKYQEYKVEFRKTQIADFFTTHKDEEWFRNKYHPDDVLSYRKKLKAAVRKRAAVFVDMLQSGWFETYSMTTDQGEDIIKLLDAAVIKFEGGTDLDLQVLDKPVVQEVKTEVSSKDGFPSKSDGQNESKEIDQVPCAVSPSSVPLPETPAPPSASVKNAAFKVQDIKPLEMSDPSPEQVKLREEAQKYHQQKLQREQQQDQEGQQKPQPKLLQEQGQKRKRKRHHREPYYYDGNGESESESESDIESEPAPPGEETARTDAQERAAEESLLPPGVDTEPISADEVMVDQGGAVAESVQPPGGDENPDSLEPKHPEADKRSQDIVADVENESDGKQGLTEETTETKVSPAEGTTAVPEVQKEEIKTENDNAKEVILKTKAQLEESNTKEKENIETVKQEEIGDQSKRRESESGEKMDMSGDVTVKSEESKETEKDDPEQDDPEPLKEPTMPRALHRTLSLFVRNVPPKISHSDIASVCGRFPGFMRVVLSDTAPERKFSRRGWITFKPDVHIKDICWAINNIKIKEVELNPIVNRELARRVRNVSGAAVLKDLVKSDISMAKKLIEQLDEKLELWKNIEEEPLKKAEEKTTGEEEEDDGEKPVESTEAVAPPEEQNLAPKESEVEIVELVPESNPVLALVPSSLSDDVSPAKEETTTSAGDEEGQITEEGLVPDDGKEPPSASSHPSPVVDGELVKLLDRLLLYLRIVHSLDYYSGAEYLYEDDMPNRCGIIHIRCSLPEKINYVEVTQWHKNLHQKLDQHLQEKKHLSDENANELGKKDQDQEMAKFVLANTQELAKDKWLCPLSGKKFRGPEFVKKHIFNKHADKVEGVKTEVTFFNNFVYDPERPCEPEVKPVSHTTPGSQPFPAGVTHPVGMPGGMGWGRGGGMMQPGGRGGFAASHVSTNYRPSPEQYNNRGHPAKAKRGSARRDPRQIVEYKDLDAPGDDFELF